MGGRTTDRRATDDRPVKAQIFLVRFRRRGDVFGRHLSSARGTFEQARISDAPNGRRLFLCAVVFVVAVYVIVTVDDSVNVLVRMSVLRPASLSGKPQRFVSFRPARTEPRDHFVKHISTLRARWCVTLRQHSHGRLVRYSGVVDAGCRFRSVVTAQVSR